MKRTVALVSGLPLNSKRPTSFEHQLRLLARVFRETGRETAVLGPDGLPRLAQGDAPAAAILLGYPDQFPFLRSGETEHFPVFLWSQCSRPPDPASFGHARIVPLTGKTEGFLRQADVTRLLPIIPHGIDAGLFRPLDAERRAKARASLGVSDTFVVGAVGANTMRKRFDLIAEAFALFAKRHKNSTLLIKTDREASPFGVDIPAFSRKLGVRSSVRLITRALSPEGLRDLYGAMDLYVNLSEWEGFCLPVVEAMACGVPIVTHRVQGPGELVPYDALVASDSDAFEDGGALLLRANVQTAQRLITLAAEDRSTRDKAAESGLAAARAFDVLRVVRLWETEIRKANGT